MRYRWEPVYPTSDQPVVDVRASDAERSEVADRLGRHFSDGRLDQAEFQTRLEQAMEAKKRSDLEGLFDDLPRLDTQPPPEATPRRRRFIPLIIVIALVVAAAGSTASVVHVPWLLVGLVGLFLWYRVGRHHIGPRPPSELGR
ncbi:MAG TPA: DUF1707 domain-containing protein [Acidimicrobiales bacterium]|jgi:hypothetical protein|nr:DUF1707 domain-containing protein [Acidimicrobiales bacterium]